MGTTPPPLNTNNILTFQSTKITGTTILFHQFNPPSLQLANAQMNTWTKTGALQNNAGGANNPLQGEWSMTRVCDTAKDLFTWFQDTNQKGVAAQQDNVTVTILAADGTTHIGTWTMNGTYPIGYAQSGMDANSNSALTESITFHSTDCSYAAGS